MNMSIHFAPHVTLDEMMKEAAERANAPLALLTSLLRTARVAELSSFGRIADDRLKVIERLEEVKNDANLQEDSFQHLIERAPWLVNPEWAPVTANQALSSLRQEFERYYEQEKGEPIQLSDDLMDSFLNDANNEKFKQFFHGFHITLVCDKLAISGSRRAAFDGYLRRGILTHFSWRNFLLRTKVVHDAFLREARRQRAWTDRGDS